ncbi:hypothetical protein T08_1123 [Trichinella sp. T8]|nr:hypothetical protein T08_1123 [Trichinella sp. T8]
MDEYTKGRCTLEQFLEALLHPAPEYPLPFSQLLILDQIHFTFTLIHLNSWYNNLLTNGIRLCFLCYIKGDAVLMPSILLHNQQYQAL